jgi:hypothetical protein
VTNFGVDPMTAIRYIALLQRVDMMIKHGTRYK